MIIPPQQFLRFPQFPLFRLNQCILHHSAFRLQALLYHHYLTHVTVIVGLSSISEQKQLTSSHNSDLTARKWAKLRVIYLITRHDISH